MDSDILTMLHPMYLVYGRHLASQKDEERPLHEDFSEFKEWWLGLPEDSRQLFEKNMRDHYSKEHKWSDPLIDLQVERLTDYVSQLSEGGAASYSRSPKDIAECVSSWSGMLLNKTYGRITAEEFFLVTSLFGDAERAISELADRNFEADTEQYKNVMVYVERIRSRSKSTMES